MRGYIASEHVKWGALVSSSVSRARNRARGDERDSRAPAFPSSLPCRSRCRALAGLVRAQTFDDIQPRALCIPPPKSFAHSPRTLHPANAATGITVWSALRAGFRMISKRDRRRRTVKKAVAWAPAGIRSRRELLRLRRRPSGAMVHGIHRLAAALGVWPFAGVLRHTGISGTNGRGRRSYSDPIETASCRTKSSYRVGYSSGRGRPTAGQHRRRTPTAWLGI